MKVTVTLSANAGVAIHIDGYRIWVDALHTMKQPGFSAVDIPLQRRMLQCEAFADPDLILYTHCHPDHFSDVLTNEAQRLWPKAKAILPERYNDGQVQIGDQEVIYSVGDLSVRFVKLPHEGQQYANCIHYGLLIMVNGKIILIPGDCATGAPELQKAIEGCSVDLALLNFPWLTLKRGQSFVDEIIKPSQILLYHLPFEQDDTSGYRHAARKAVQKLQKDNVHLLCEPLQTIKLDI
ncbi:MAG: hypothetical protein IJF02_02475 [Oscillospiraceae bacterium]|nr:hypothetical protein [Oscillospiraceae bacterium]